MTKAANLKVRGYNAQVAVAVERLRREANNHTRSLYQNNKAVHEMLRYGVSAKTDPGKPYEVIHLIDWKTPDRNDFAIAEEVTLMSGYNRRPDIVLFVNGIAIGVLELKNSRVSIEEGIYLICEPVPPPRDDNAYRRYFCGNTEMASDLADREPLRATFYKTCAALVRAFAHIADDLDMAGYSAPEVDEIKRFVADYVKLRDMVRNASGETLDLKAYEADMRHLIDTYIEAAEPITLFTLLESGLRAG
jgi:Type I restriction enzyme R protein N terminus (HSDR_N)